tara:strand:- start:128 stop:430 length:303 start_codon:yes stop_codon:yes gene_type:complete
MEPFLTTDAADAAADATPPKPYLKWCAVGLIAIHLVLVVAVLCGVGALAPQLKTTMDDVQVMVPQMTLTLRELGKMLPEIKEGMRVLEHLCNQSPGCTPS